MPVSCPACGKANRDTAKFCKFCGSAVRCADDLLGDLVGLDDIRDALAELKNTIEGMRRNNLPVRLAFNLLVIGNSGTAKSLIGDLVAGLLHTLGVSTRQTATTIDARHRDSMKTTDLDQIFTNAKGGVLFIDHLHELVKGGKPDPLLLHLSALMEKSPADPVVICAGHRYELFDFVKQDQNKGFTGNFNHIFCIEDYSAVQMAAIAERQLQKPGFTLGDGVRERLERRFAWLFREGRKANNSLSASNGKLVAKEVENYLRVYFQRPTGTDRVIQPEDIVGQLEEKKTIEEILQRLDGYIGMDNIKQDVRRLYNVINDARATAERTGSPLKLPARHITITGNPGTGKTTIARDLGEIFQALGLLTSGHVVEVDRSKLVGEYQGHTAPRVNAQCDKAMGGILFIDEAYSLYKDDKDTFGIEAIDALLKRMEDDRGKFMVVAAGYKDRMNDFLSANPGLLSRFNTHFHIDDYTPDQLAAIFANLARLEGLGLTDEAQAAVVAYFKARYARRTKDFANGREARNLMEASKSQLSQRLFGLGRAASDDERATLTAEDIPAPAGANESASVDQAMARLGKLVGLPKVKEAVSQLRSSLEAQRILGETEALSRHYVFVGNPGTGKTTVARIMADIFHAIGLLPSNTLVEASRATLVSTFQGGTAPLVNKACDQAMGGVLLIDEAYTLSQGGDSYGHEAIATLLKRLEDDRGKFVAILTGYHREMEHFLDSNSGLRSRFSDIIEFEDYCAADMETIFKAMQAEKSITGGEGFEAALQARLEEIYRGRSANFANARTVRQLFDKTNENCKARALAMAGADEDSKRREMRIFQVEDLDRTVTG